LITNFIQPKQRSRTCPERPIRSQLIESETARPILRSWLASAEKIIDHPASSLLSIALVGSGNSVREAPRELWPRMNFMDLAGVI